MNPAHSWQTTEWQLLTDGGEDENEQNEQDENEQNEQDENEQNEQDENEQDAEGSVEGNGDGGDGDGGDGEEARVALVDLDGLFVDVLGLEVDLDRVNLQVDAVRGSGNLLGNLLAAVAELLDSGLGGGVRNLLDRLLEGVPGIGGSGDGDEGEGSGRAAVTERIRGTVSNVAESLRIRVLPGTGWRDRRPRRRSLNHPSTRLPDYAINSPLLLRRH